MAEAPEHTFLSQILLETLQQFSRTQLYSYTEADRKMFDFACHLQRDWDRLLVGQTLWKHDEGIDKDIRTLITQENAGIWAYVARHTIQNVAHVAEVINGFRETRYRDQLFKLKVFWVVPDFDADNEEARVLVGSKLREQVVQDILLNVVFGNLTGEDIRVLHISSEHVGMDLAVLYEIAHNPDISDKELCYKLLIDGIQYRWSLHNLLSRGFLWQEGVYGRPRVSSKGRAFLSLLYRLFLAMENQPKRELPAFYPPKGQDSSFQFRIFEKDLEEIPGTLSPELKYILSKLDLNPDDNTSVEIVDFSNSANLSAEERQQLITRSGNWSSKDWCASLFTTIRVLTEQRGIDLTNVSFPIDAQETPFDTRIIR